MKDISSQIFSLLENNQQAVVLIEENYITHANNRAYKLFKVLDKKLKKIKIEDIFNPDTVSEIRKNVFHQIKTDKAEA